MQNTRVFGEKPAGSAEFAYFYTYIRTQRDMRSERNKSAHVHVCVRRDERIS